MKEGEPKIKEENQDSEEGQRGPEESPQVEINTATSLGEIYNIILHRKGFTFGMLTLHEIMDTVDYLKKRVLKTLKSLSMPAVDDADAIRVIIKLDHVLTWVPETEGLRNKIPELLANEIADELKGKEKVEPEDIKEYRRRWEEAKRGSKAWERESIRGFVNASGKNKYYEILGVSPDASLDEIRSAHRKLGQIYHPDKGGNEEKMKEINGAYDFLIRLKK